MISARRASTLRAAQHQSTPPGTRGALDAPAPRLRPRRPLWLLLLVIVGVMVRMPTNTHRPTSLLLSPSRDQEVRCVARLLTTELCQANASRKLVTAVGSTGQESLHSAALRAQHRERAQHQIEEPREAAGELVLWSRVHSRLLVPTMEPNIPEATVPRSLITPTSTPTATPTSTPTPVGVPGSLTKGATTTSCQYGGLQQISVQAPWPALHPAAAASFAEVRAEVRERTGVDALATLGDALRAPHYASDKPGVATYSWHKAGRAIDLDHGGPFRVVPEHMSVGAKVYHYARVYVKNVDLTEIFLRQGWQRIPRQGAVEEWWHFEYHADVAGWAIAMRQVWPLETLARTLPAIPWRSCPRGPLPTPRPPAKTPTPTATPTTEPTQEPTDAPTSPPTPEPTLEPTPAPTSEPTATPEPTEEPTLDPTSAPTATPEPALEPTPEPAPTPSVAATVEPTLEPTPEP